MAARVKKRPAPKKSAGPRKKKKAATRVVTAPPAPSPFGAVAGDFTEYQVRLRTVASKRDEAVLAALIELFGDVFKVSQDNITASRNVVLCAWDSVYSTLTVTFTDAKRSAEGRDVLKLVCRGWDTERQKADDIMGSVLDERRHRQMREWLRFCAREAEEVTVQLFPIHRVVFGFTTDPSGRRFQKLA